MAGCMSTGSVANPAGMSRRGTGCRLPRALTRGSFSFGGCPNSGSRHPSPGRSMRKRPKVRKTVPFVPSSERPQGGTSCPGAAGPARKTGARSISSAIRTGNAGFQSLVRSSHKTDSCQKHPRKHSPLIRSFGIIAPTTLSAPQTLEPQPSLTSDLSVNELIPGVPTGLPDAAQLNPSDG